MAIYTPLEQCQTTLFAPDKGSEAVLRLEMSSDVERQLSCHENSFLGEAHERLSNTGFPHLLVDVISANNARSCDKESTSGGHFLYLTFLKMAVEYAPILQKALIFARREQKRAYCLLNFKK